MSIYLPKKLATTIGCELTFIPGIFQDMYEASGVETWKQYEESSVRVYYSQVLKAAMDKASIPYYKCTTDPFVIEVCTVETNSAANFKNTVKTYHRMANKLGMYSNASYCKGGGAHIHSGIIDHPSYVPLMANFAVTNPWLSFAFANPRDNDNAQAWTKAQLKKPASYSRERSRTDIINDIKTSADTEIMYRDRLVKETNDYLHHAKFLHDGSAATRRNYTWREGYWADDLDYIRRRMITYKERVADRLKELAAYDIARYNIPAATNPAMRKLDAIYFPEGKSNALSRRHLGKHGTIEFRAFLMPDTWHGHIKQVALVDAIVRYVNKQCEQGISEVDDTLWYSVEDLRAMKYSDMVKGFNAMLTMLDFNPNDWREERVNMAIRKRFMRTRSCPTYF